MSETRGHSRASGSYALGVKIAVPLLVAVLLGAGTALWTQESRLTTLEATSRKTESHSNRLTVLEVRSEGIKEDVQEIKADVKKLLQEKNK